MQSFPHSPRHKKYHSEMRNCGSVRENMENMEGGSTPYNELTLPPLDIGTKSRQQTLRLHESLKNIGGVYNPNPRHPQIMHRFHPSAFCIYNNKALQNHFIYKSTHSHTSLSRNYQLFAPKYTQGGNIPINPLNPYTEHKLFQSMRADLGGNMREETDLGERSTPTFSPQILQNIHSFIQEKNLDENYRFNQRSNTQIGDIQINKPQTLPIYNNEYNNKLSFSKAKNQKKNVPRIPFLINNSEERSKSNLALLKGKHHQKITLKFEQNTTPNRQFTNNANTLRKIFLRKDIRLDFMNKKKKFPNP